MRRIRPAYSNIVASLALFIALGGTSYAITKLPKDSVGSSQVRDGSLQMRDLATGARVAGPRGPRGAQGPAGAAGAVGLQGPAGERGASDAILADAGPSVAMTGTTGNYTEVRRLSNVPAGSWILLFNANGYLGAATHTTAVCRLTVNGDQKAESHLVVGQTSAGVQEGGIEVHATATETAPFTVKAECYQDQSVGVTIGRPQLLAVQVARITHAP